MLLVSCCHVQRPEEQLRKKSSQSIVNSRRASRDSSALNRQTSSAGRSSSIRSVGGVNVGIGSVAAGEVKPEDVVFTSEAEACTVDGSLAAGDTSKVQESADAADGQAFYTKAKNASALFKQLDKDGDGIVTQAELALAFSRGLLGTGAEALSAKLSGKNSPRGGQETGKKDGPHGKDRPQSARSARSNSSSRGRVSSKDKTKEIMPFRKQRLQRQDAFSRRKSVTCMEGYLDGTGADPTAAASAAGAPEQDFAAFAPSSVVIRGRDWKWGDEDGGAGNTGTIVASNESTKTVTVHWDSSGKRFDHYRCNSKMDLSLSTNAGGAAQKLSRRSTQHLFADPSQTFIVLDWDDTLFPTTYVRDDLNLCWQTPMKNQRLQAREKNEITRNLQRCSDRCCSLLEDACASGKVVLVTLARSPWVDVSCANFFPAVGEFIKANEIPVIYAQECEEVDYDKMAMSSNSAVEKHWAQVKGRAIAKQLQEFYSQYAGQSWKNIISIGDSDFERLGTQQATQDYMKQTGISRAKTVELKGHVYKVRTKTFKMLDQPTVEELAVELALLQKWLNLMIRLDNSFDVNLSDLEDPAVLRRIERTLNGSTGTSKTR